MLRTQISHTFSVSHNKRSTFLCTRNGKGVVHIALFMYGFYHFVTYNATKTFWRAEEVCQKTNNYYWDYTSSYKGKVNCFPQKNALRFKRYINNIPVAGI